MFLSYMFVPLLFVFLHYLLGIIIPKIFVGEYKLYEVFIVIILSGVRLSLLDTAATIGLLYQPQMIDDGDCGALVE
jgi:hypothetical protein